MAAIVLLGGLAGFYVWQSGRQRVADAEAAEAAEAESASASTTVTLINRDESDVISVVFTADGHSFTLKRQAAVEEDEEDQWFLVEHPEIELNQTSAKDMVRGLTYLSVADTVLAETDNPAEYGITEGGATAVATYADGGTATVRIGKMTPAKDRYYMMLDGDPAVYLLLTYYGNRYYNDVDALLDTTLATIDANSIEYVLIAAKDRPVIEFGFDGTEEERTAMYEQYGMVSVTMMQPYPGRELYYSSFETNVLTAYNEFTIGDLVALKPDDLSIYGLDEPSLEVRFTDAEGDNHLLFGDTLDDGEHIYCMIVGKPHVFLADYAYVEALYNINVFTFIEKFIALINIQDCVGIDIEWPGNPDRSHRMEIGHELDEDEYDVVVPFVDGLPVQELAFKTVYRYLIGLSYDTEVETFTPDSPPVFSITYHLADGESTTIHFYTYNSNFYAVQRDDNPIQFVTNKQATELVLDSVPDLLAGKLDRDY